jgi:hypothetical protein
MEEGQGSNNEAREPVEAELETFDLQMRWLQIGNGVCKHGIVFPFDAAAECEEFVETFTAKFPLLKDLLQTASKQPSLLRGKTMLKCGKI